MSRTPVSLLERLRQPLNEAAWTRFVELYTPLLFYWARRLGLESHAAADVVQEVFAILVQKLPGFVYDPNKTFRGWLRTVLQNKVREQQRHRLPVCAAPPDFDAPAAPDDGEEAEYRRELVRRTLGLLQPDFPPRVWQAYEQYVINGKPVAEVAAALGMSINSVYLAKSRVLKRLRQELDGLLEL